MCRTSFSSKSYINKFHCDRMRGFRQRERTSLTRKLTQTPWIKVERHKVIEGYTQLWPWTDIMQSKPEAVHCQPVFDKQATLKRRYRVIVTDAGLGIKQSAAVNSIYPNHLTQHNLYIVLLEKSILLCFHFINIFYSLFTVQLVTAMQRHFETRLVWTGGSSDERYKTG